MQLLFVLHIETLRHCQEFGPLPDLNHAIIYVFVIQDRTAQGDGAVGGWRGGYSGPLVVPNLWRKLN